MNPGIVKPTQDIDTIYKKTSENTHIEKSSTSNTVGILRATRELSQNITIQTVAYKVINKYLLIPTQRLNIIEENNTRVKSNNITYSTIFL